MGISTYSSVERNQGLDRLKCGSESKRGWRLRKCNIKTRKISPYSVSCKNYLSWIKEKADVVTCMPWCWNNLKSEFSESKTHFVFNRNYFFIWYGFGFAVDIRNKAQDRF